MTGKPNDVRAPRELLENIAAWLERANEKSDEDIAECIQLRALLAQPADQQGEPVAIVVEETHNYAQYLVFGEGLRGANSPRPVVERKAHLFDQALPAGTKLYLHAQPATAKVDDEEVKAFLNTCEVGGYRDVDGDWVKRMVFDEKRADRLRAKLNGGSDNAS
jgi:hypothetical protein